MAYITGTVGNDTLTGTVSADNILGFDGDDTLVGGAGNDNLYGDAGNDTYVFAVGDGVDHISDNDLTVGNLDVVSFTGVASTALTALERQGNALVLKYGTSDQAIVDNYFSTSFPGYKIEQFKFSDGLTWDEAGIKARVTTMGTTAGETIIGYIDGPNRIYGLDGNDVLYGGAFADLLDGGTGGDTLWGGDGNDTMVGGTGTDKLYGEAGADRLNGGGGNDTLNGGVGNDTYVFAVGDGVDHISDNDLTVGNLDVASFTGVASTAVTALERQGKALVLKYGTSDQVIVDDYFYTYLPGYKVEQFKFSDGVTWDEAGIKARVITMGTTAGETIIGYTDGPNRIYGLDGNDVLYGGAFADLLDGGTGDEIVKGGAGNDTLIGGAGNDTLYGGEGNDTYVFAVGDGVDHITDYDTTVGNLDVVRFTGVASTALTALERQGNTLVLKSGTSDQVIIKDYFYESYPGYKIEQFSFSDGVTWDDAAIKARAITMGTSSGETIAGYIDGPNQIYGLDGNDSLYGGASTDLIDGGTGDDIVRGGDGDDRLVGGVGNDRLYGDVGADQLTGGAGNDVLDGGLGNDTYVFAVGDGVDHIGDNDLTAGNLDVASFTGVASTALTALERQGKALVLKYGTSDQVIVDNYFYPSFPGSKVEQFKFSDGVTWDEAGIKARVITMGTSSGETIIGYTDGPNRIYGLDGNDVLYGGAFADLLDGGTGDDTFWGGDGTDTLVGGIGNDTLYGEAGADRLNGGVGNDTLNGGVGNDTYLFAVGDGVDHITDYDTTTGNLDVASFTGVASTAVTALERQGNALVLKYGTSDQTIVDNYFSTSFPGYKVEQFKFSDGVTWDEAGIKARVTTMGTTAGETIIGYTDGPNRIYGLDGNDVLYGGAFADLVDGGIGDDMLRGGGGNDTLRGGAGNDKVYGEIGDDIIDGGLGSDTLVGGSGNDRYVVDDVGDVVAENLNEGVDTVQSAITYTLGSNVENLTLTGTAALNGTGNTLNNRLTGNSAANVLTGGAGNDTYVVGTGDTVIEYANEGTDTVQSAITWALGADVENLTLIGTGAINGMGNGLNNTLVGNSASNVLNGAGGNDTYRYSRGGGQDLVADNAGASDSLRFGTTIDPLDLVISRQVNDLRLSIHSSTDSVTVQNWYTGSANQIETIQAGNGQTLLSTQVDQLIQAMASFTQQTGLTWDQAIDQRPQDVQTILAASWQ